MTKFKPMLASAVTPAQLDDLQYPLMCSPKLDGIRVIVRGGRVLTRSLKEVPNRFIQEELGSDVFEGMDGEILVGDPCDPLVFRKTTSAVMSQDGEPEFTFWVFDWLTEEPKGFMRRFQDLEHFFNADPEDLAETYPFMRLVPHPILETPKAVMDYEDELVRQGYEGIMLRSLSGPYKNGRSTLKEGFLLKLKRFVDSEAVIVGFQERMHNANEAKINELGHTERSTHKENMVGRGDLGAFWAIAPKPGRDTKSLLAEVADRVIALLPELAASQAALKKFNETNPDCWLFTVGSGFDDETRARFWSERPALLKQLTIYKHMEYGGFDGPRFPVYKGLRDVRDL